MTVCVAMKDREMEMYCDNALLEACRHEMIVGLKKHALINSGMVAFCPLTPFEFKSSKKYFPETS